MTSKSLGRTAANLPYDRYYESGELFQVSSSNISWIGSLQSFLLLFIGALTGPIYDAGYFRALLLTGSFLVVFGHMMLSLCTEYWQAMLAQAVVVGLGAGCLFVPSVAILSTYFSTKIATSMGLAASGSSLGGVIYPIMFYKLQPQIGFAWTTRVIGFVALATLAIPCTVMKMRVKPPAKRSLWDWSALREPAYVIYVLGAFVAFMGLYVIFFYISYYALSQHIAGENLAFYLLPILNAFSVFGRVSFAERRERPIAGSLTHRFSDRPQLYSRQGRPVQHISPGGHGIRHPHAVHARRKEPGRCHCHRRSLRLLLGHVRLASSDHLRQAQPHSRRYRDADGHGFHRGQFRCPDRCSRGRCHIGRRQQLHGAVDIRRGADPVRRNHVLCGEDDQGRLEDLRQSVMPVKTINGR